MKKIYGCFVILFPVLLNAEFTRSSLLIDIPTAYVLKDGIVRISGIGSFALAGKDPYPYDFDFSAGYGIGNLFELSLTGYTLKDYAFGFTARIVRESDYIPMVGIGIHDITYRKYISSLGSGDNMRSVTWPDDTLYYTPKGERRRFTRARAFENISAFVVASKTFGKYSILHIGIGRGRYVGYEKFSKIFNTDIWSPNVVRESAFGLFWGFEIIYEDFISLALEFDGRDLNFGGRLKFKHWEPYIAWTKLEHAFPGTEYSPRLVVGASVYATPFIEKKYAGVKGYVRDVEGRPVAANIYIYSETQMFKTRSDRRGFFKSPPLPPGSYKVIAKTREYKSKAYLIEVVREKMEHLDIVVEKITEMGSIKGHVYNKEGKPLKGKVVIMETGEVVHTLPNTGEYEFHGLEEGKYTLSAEAKGYFPSKTVCKVEKGKETSLNFYLSKHWVIFYFNPGEEMIEPRYMPALEDALNFLKRHPDMIVEIQGHTDSVGDAKENLVLSRKRANAVKDFFIKRGICPSRLIAKGYGELHPIADNRTSLGRDLNRRVELVVIR